MIKLNLNMLNKCEHARAHKDKFRPDLDSVHICDNGRTRHYVATNAQIMVVCTEKIPEDENTLQEEYGLDSITLCNYRQQKLSKGQKTRTELKVDGDRYTLGNLCEQISDKPYLRWQAVMPRKVEPITTWRVIKPAYLVKLEKVFGVLWPLENPMGHNDDILAPIVFEQGYTKVLVMPMLPSDYHKQKNKS